MKSNIGLYMIVQNKKLGIPCDLDDSWHVAVREVRDIEKISFFSNNKQVFRLIVPPLSSKHLIVNADKFNYRNKVSRPHKFVGFSDYYISLGEYYILGKKRSVFQ